MNVATQVATAAPKSTTISTTAPLTGGGNLTANRTFAISAAGAATATADGSAGSAIYAKDSDKTSRNKAATPMNVATQVATAAPNHYLCEFYLWRHPTLKPGFQPAQGGLLENAATLYPEAWAYLQTTAGKLLCKTEAQWQALTKATWATLADGTKIGWDGIGGAPFYAPDTATGALRLPDLRGMYAEAVGFDSLTVGGVHGDGTRRLFGYLPGFLTSDIGSPQASNDSALYWRTTATVTNQKISGSCYDQLAIDSQRTLPTAAKTQPRAWGALACVYLGRPS
jgi:hypothetical protein